MCEDTTLADNNERTPLCATAFIGCHTVMEWLIASGRDLGDINKKGRFGDREYSSLELGNEHAEVILRKFMANPTQTRHELRVKLGAFDELAAEVFALTVFLHDDLLQLKPASHLATPDHAAAAAATRFFTIISKLPMELQMMLCHRAVGSRKQNILHIDSETAFKSLVRILLHSQTEQAVGP